MDLKEILAKDSVTIVDVREPMEYAMGHVDGAINIPLSTIFQHVDDFRRMRKPIVVYCRSGNRSAQAEAFLRAQGITDVYNGGSLEEMEYYKAQIA